jgi:hypothetical protein
LLTAARPMLVPAEEADPLAFWRRAFALTYHSELRAERRERAASVVDGDPQRYLRFTGPVLDSAGLGSVDANGRMLLAPISNGEQEHGRKLWLAKASATFAGGIDYLAWKINRHAGTDLAIKPWQRRWPLLGAFTLLPRLLKRGAVR